MSKSKNRRSSKERNSDYTKTRKYLEYCDGMHCYGFLVSQHQSKFLGLQFDELKFNFIKDKIFLPLPNQNRLKLFSYSLKYITEMAELTLKFTQVSVKCHCLKSLILDNIPVKKLNTLYIVFWTSSKQSNCPG